jgi:hypothetical protein
VYINVVIKRQRMGKVLEGTVPYFKARQRMVKDANGWANDRYGTALMS